MFSPSVVFHPLAEKEYREAYFWYEERMTGLGDRFDSEVDHAINRIVKNPLSFPIAKNCYRIAHITTFPYSIIFELADLQNTLYIHSIYHQKRNPAKKFRKRI